MEFNLKNITRENIKNMKPYSSARHEFSGAASVFLDANENAFGSPLPVAYNRYPDPLQIQVKEKLSTIKGVPPQNIFLGNGSDEAIDLLFRIFCEPGRDNVLLFPPTYGMYEVCAEVNNVNVKKINLTKDFQLDLDSIEHEIDASTKLIFICSPNNPTGNSINRNDIEILLNNFNGIVAIDEAYINYSRQKSFISELTEYPNLVVLQTLSKAWGLAGLRLGMAFASQPIINLMNKVKYPYNISSATQQIVLKALNKIEWVNEHIRQTIQEKEKLVKSLGSFTFIETIYPSDANFLLVKINKPKTDDASWFVSPRTNAETNAKAIYKYLLEQGIIVRDRSNIILCADCLRITIGTPGENILLIEALKNYKP